MLGMHLAQQLAAAGHDVTLVESSPELGGMAAPWAIGPVTWDRHYHVIAPGDQRTIALVRELGLEDDLQWQSVPAGCESEGTVSPATTPGEIVRLPFLRANRNCDWPRPPPEQPPSAILPRSRTYS